jgi:hypothetical protein
VNEASAAEVAEVIERCPSGALHYSINGNGAEEIPDSPSSAIPIENGPLYVRGDLRIRMDDGEMYTESRAALCRCGQSENKPFCDNTHQSINFQVAGN